MMKESESIMSRNNEKPTVANNEKKLFIINFSKYIITNYFNPKMILCLEIIFCNVLNIF